MDDAQKTRSQLLQELATLRQRVAALEHAETARLQAEAALRERDARIRAILETTVDGIITIDEQGLIEQLLHFGRACDASLAPVNVQVPLWRAVQLVQSRFRREGITLLFEVPDNLPWVLGVANQLEQVFLNVLVNGWHALPAGGTITIQADVPDDHYVHLMIRDNGVGMSAEDLARAFEPFYSTKGERGTGLGLTMCRQLIERHGGMIRLDSMPRMGTTVTMVLVQAPSHQMTECRPL